MSVSLTCRHCNLEMSAGDEEQLVAVVQQHVAGHAAEHGREHTVSREDVLARLALNGQAVDLAAGEPARRRARRIRNGTEK